MFSPTHQQFLNLRWKESDPLFRTISKVTLCVKPLVSRVREIGISLIFALALPQAFVGCGDNTAEFHQRGVLQKATEQTADTAAPEEATSPDGFKELPPGISPPASPFHLSKFQLPEDALGLTGDGKPAERKAVIFLVDRSECRSAAASLQGFRDEELKPFVEGELLLTLVGYSRDELQGFADDPCVIGITSNHTFEPSSIDFFPQSTLNYTPDLKEYFGSSDTKITVAVIDSGIDTESKDFDAINADYRVTSYIDGITGDDPRDRMGHGTSVASRIAHKKYGFAAGLVNIVPIRVLKPEGVSSASVATGIAMAVNRGAEVINLSLGGRARGCDGAMGYAIYKGLQKGAFFVFGAGNGAMPVIAARADGMPSLEFTESPACWGRYFLGAVSVAATDKKGQKLAKFSNFGDAVELSAPGEDVITVSTDGWVGPGSGTSFSAPVVSAAAAIAIHHHKKNGFPYYPWYIENLLVESSKSILTLDPEYRNRMSAAVDFANLANLLQKTESMTAEQRRNEIRTINPRQGDGWDPQISGDKLQRLDLVFERDTLKSQEETSFQATIVYRDGQQKNVTMSPHLTVTSFNPFLKITEPGRIKFIGKTDKKDEATITVSFTEKQRQIYQSGTINLLPTNADEPEPTLSAIRLVKPDSILRIAAAHYAMNLDAVYSDGSIVRVTGGAEFRSSSPKELSTTVSPGVFSAENAVAGKTYTIFASYQDKQDQLELTIPDESVSDYIAHTALGENPLVAPGQKLIVEAQLLLDQKRKVLFGSEWKLNGKVVQSGKSIFEIDTSSLSFGTHTITISTIYKSVSGNTNLTKTFVFRVDQRLEGIRVELEPSVISAGQAFFAVAKAYYDSNSDRVLAEDVFTSNDPKNNARWSISDAQKISIQPSGLGFAETSAAGKEYTVNATYNFGGKAYVADAAAKLFVVQGSVVSGNRGNAKAISAIVGDFPRYQSGNLPDFCAYPQVSDVLIYSDTNTIRRNLNSQSISYSQKEADGNWGPIVLPLREERQYRASFSYNPGVNAGDSQIGSVSFPVPELPSNFTPLVSSIPGPHDGRYRYGTITDDRLIEFGGLPANFPTCAGLTWEVTPAQGLDYTGGPTGFFSFEPGDSTPGLYTVRRTQVYPAKNGNITLSAEAIIEIAFEDPSKPVGLDISVNGQPLNVFTKGGKGFLGHGSYSLEHRYRFIGNADRNLFPELTWTIRNTSTNSVVDLAAKDSFYIDNINVIRSNFVVMTKLMDQNFVLRATDSTTGFFQDIPFQVIGAFERPQVFTDINAKLADLPSRTAPVASNAVAASCQNVSAAVTGSGSANDPYIVCTTEHLRSLPALCDPSKIGNNATCFVEQGKNIDFGSKQIEPITFYGYSKDWANKKETPQMWGFQYNGRNHSIGNYVIIDSETKFSMALFRGVTSRNSQYASTFRNLILTNPTVIGQHFVSALVTSNTLKVETNDLQFLLDQGTVLLENVAVVGGLVKGKNRVAGVTDSAWIGSSNVRVYETQIEADADYVAGVALEGPMIEKALFSGLLKSTAPGTSKSNIGGILHRGTVHASIFSGEILVTNPTPSPVGCIGGIAGSGWAFFGNVAEGKIVTNLSGVGGIVGCAKSIVSLNSRVKTGNYLDYQPPMSWGSGYFGFIPPLVEPYPQTQTYTAYQTTGRGYWSNYIGYNRVSTRIRAGISRFAAECMDDLRNSQDASAVGNCAPDSAYRTSSISGGIAGTADSIYFEDNQFNGSIRGVAEIGGLVGRSRSNNFVDNQVPSGATVSASDGLGWEGRFVGSDQIAEMYPAIPSRFDRNSAPGSHKQIGRQYDVDKTVVPLLGIADAQNVPSRFGN